MHGLTGNQAWTVIAATVVAHELTAPQGQLLSHAADNARAKHPIITNALIAATALHLLRAIPVRFDLYAGFGYPLLSALKRRPA